MRRLLCSWFGHDARTVASPSIISCAGPDHWYWPGAITYCRRCGYAFRNAAGAPTSITKVSIECEWKSNE